MSQGIRYIFAALLGVILYTSCGVRNGSTVSSSNNVLSLDKRTSFDSLFFEAIHLHNKEEYDRAYIVYQQLAKIDPKAPFPYYAMAKYNITQLNNYSKAKDLSKTAYTLQPDNKFYTIYYADLLARAGKYDKSIALFEGMISKGDYAIENFYKLLVLYEVKKDRKKILHTIDRMSLYTAMDEEYLESLRLEVHRQNKDDSAILNAIHNLTKLAPQNNNYKILLVEYYTDRKQQHLADSVYKTIVFREGNDNDQVSYYYSLIQRNDTNEIKKRMKQAFSKDNAGSNDYNNLINALGVSAEKYPNFVKWFFEEMSQVYQRENNLIPEGAEFLITYAVSTEEFERARVFARKAVAFGSKKVDVFNLAIAPFFEKKENDSIIYYSKIAIANNDSFSMGYYTKAIAYYFKGNDDSVIFYNKKALEYAGEGYNDEYRSELYGNLGDVYERKKEYRLSEAAYDSAIALNPENTTVLNNYAYYLSLRGQRLDDALRMSAQSLSIKKDEPTFLDTYGWIYYQLGEYTKAKQYVSLAIDKSDEPSAELYHHLGDIELKLNNKTQAILHWKKALELAGEDNAATIQQKIKQHNEITE